MTLDAALRRGPATLPARGERVFARKNLRQSRIARVALMAVVAAGLSLPLAAQQQPPRAQMAGPSTSSDVASLLTQIEQAGMATAADLGKLRIDKWKTDSATRQQSQQNADSLARNISSALPGMLQQVRSAPNSVAAQFKLYRNINALYDVLSGLTESAGAFGSKSDYQTLSEELNAFDRARIGLADHLQTMTAQQDAEISRLRQVQTAAATPAPAPKKIVVDDNAPTNTTRKKSTKKKTTPPPTTSQ